MKTAREYVEEVKKMSRRKRNPNQFTTDEAQTATLINTEGDFPCIPTKPRYRYPYIRISMCDREALEPAERVFGTKIVPIRTKQIECSPELFPPDGRGRYVIQKGGKGAIQIMEKLKPLITKHHYKKWEEVVSKCH